jgi:hypothetical protein|eukprot:COSAG02_NODE_1517_length_12181_cov_5.653038_11_plen_134_part_00
MMQRWQLYILPASLTLCGLIRLKRRIETLVRTIEKELEGPLKKDKEKRRASAGGSKRKASLDGTTGGGGKVRPTSSTCMLMWPPDHPCLTVHLAKLCSEMRSRASFMSTEKEDEMMMHESSLMQSMNFVDRSL